jgi:hypothetical protein
VAETVASWAAILSMQPDAARPRPAALPALPPTAPSHSRYRSTFNPARRCARRAAQTGAGRVEALRSGAAARGARRRGAEARGGAQALSFEEFFRPFAVSPRP